MLTIDIIGDPVWVYDYTCELQAFMRLLGVDKRFYTMTMKLILSMGVSLVKRTQDLEFLRLTYIRLKDLAEYEAACEAFIDNINQSGSIYDNMDFLGNHYQPPGYISRTQLESYGWMLNEAFKIMQPSLMSLKNVGVFAWNRSTANGEASVEKFKELGILERILKDCEIAARFLDPQEALMLYKQALWSFPDLLDDKLNHSQVRIFI